MNNSFKIFQNIINGKIINIIDNLDFYTFIEENTKYINDSTEFLNKFKKKYSNNYNHNNNNDIKINDNDDDNDDNIIKENNEEIERLVPPYINSCVYNKKSNCVKPASFMYKGEYYCWLHCNNL